MRSRDQRPLVGVAEDFGERLGGDVAGDAVLLQLALNSQAPAALDVQRRPRDTRARRARRRGRRSRAGARSPRRSSSWGWSLVGEACAALARPTARAAPAASARRGSARRGAQPPNRVISGRRRRRRRSWPSRRAPCSAVVEMPWTFSLNSSTFDRPAQRLLERDEPLLIQAEDRLVEGLHPVLRRARRRSRRGSGASSPCRRCSRG